MDDLKLQNSNALNSDPCGMGEAQLWPARDAWGFRGSIILGQAFKPILFVVANHSTVYSVVHPSLKLFKVSSNVST